MNTFKCWVASWFDDSTAAQVKAYSPEEAMVKFACGSDLPDRSIVTIRQVGATRRFKYTYLAPVLMQVVEAKE